FTAEYDPNVLNVTANRQFTGSEGDEMGYLPMGLALNVDGGKGHDVLKLTTTRADYALERNGNALEITRLNDGAMLSLQNAESIAFDNGDILHLTHNGVEATLARLFQTFLNRDASVSEWQLGKQAATDYQAGRLSADVVFAWFQAHNSSLAKMDNTTYVQTLYQNTYGRQANTTELNGHLAELQNNTLDRNGLAVKLAASSEAITAIGTVMQFDGWV
ncbi:DUF4214 domain-containing protein, partial [Aquaspirillum serpens]|uniref:DUF4214 domain-containing protein n=1 Tax=Aquaspirillum serpens TaxID=190 RepID=UPI0003B4891B